MDKMCQHGWEEVEDEWQTATLEDGVEATTTGLGGFKGIRYKKEDNHVYVQGSVATTWDGSNSKILATLPERF